MSAAESGVPLDKHAYFLFFAWAIIKRPVTVFTPVRGMEFGRWEFCGEAPRGILKNNVHWLLLGADWENEKVVQKADHVLLGEDEEETHLIDLQAWWCVYFWSLLFVINHFLESITRERAWLKRWHVMYVWIKKKAGVMQRAWTVVCGVNNSQSGWMDCKKHKHIRSYIGAGPFLSQKHHHSGIIARDMGQNTWNLPTTTQQAFSTWTLMLVPRSRVQTTPQMKYCFKM